MKIDWFEVLVYVVFVCKKMVVEWVLLSWHWCMVFGLTGLGFVRKGGKMDMEIRKNCEVDCLSGLVV